MRSAQRQENRPSGPGEEAQAQRGSGPGGHPGHHQRQWDRGPSAALQHPWVCSGSFKAPEQVVGGCMTHPLCAQSPALWKGAQGQSASQAPEPRQEGAASRSFPVGSGDRLSLTFPIPRLQFAQRSHTVGLNTQLCCLGPCHTLRDRRHQATCPAQPYLTAWPCGSLSFNKDQGVWFSLRSHSSHINTMGRGADNHSFPC